MRVIAELTDFFGHGQALRVDDGGEFLLLQLLDSVLVVSEIQLGAHQDDGSVGAVVSDLRVPLRREGRGGGRSSERTAALDMRPTNHHSTHLLLSGKVFKYLPYSTSVTTTLEFCGCMNDRLRSLPSLQPISMQQQQLLLQLSRRALVQVLHVGASSRLDINIRLALQLSIHECISQLDDVTGGNMCSVTQWGNIGNLTSNTLRDI